MVLYHKDDPAAIIKERWLGHEGGRLDCNHGRGGALPRVDANRACRRLDRLRPGRNLGLLQGSRTGAASLYLARYALMYQRKATACATGRGRARSLLGEITLADLP